jgi:4-amino-4-deoxy-L-arabinose transferase-like glycosyltransferase
LNHTYTTRQYRIAVLVLTAGMVLLEMAALGKFLTFPGALGGDGSEYSTLAGNLLSHHCYATLPDCTPVTHRTPGYPLFLAAIYALGGGVVLVRVAQFALHALTALLVFETARVYLDDRTAALAALFYASYLPLAMAALYHMPEELATTAAVATVWAASRLPGRRYVFTFGVLCGVAVLVRPTLYLLPLALGMGLLLSRRASLRQMVVAAAVCLAVMSPWIARNSLVRHSLMVADPPGWSVYISARQWQGTVSYDLQAAEFLPLTQQWLRRQQKYMAAGLSNGAALRATEHDYLGEGLAVERRIPAYRYLAQFPLRMLALWGPGDEPLGIPPLDLALEAQWLSFGLLALAGAWRERKRLGEQWPLWVTAVYLSLFHSFFHTEVRFSYMGRPLLLAYAAVAVAAITARLEGERRPTAASADGGSEA